MPSPRPLAIFWAAVTVDVLALGVAWPAWKAAPTSPAALLVAALASVVGAAATAVAGRILGVVTRASSPRGRGR